MFGFKKKTVEDILSDVGKLTEEEKRKLLAALNASLEIPEEKTSEGEEAEEERLAEETSERSLAEATEKSENPPADGGTDEDGEGDGTDGENVPMAPETDEGAPSEKTPAEEVSTEAIETDVPASEPSAADNLRELVEAQSAKINALESEISALKETIDNIISNQDKQNFGLSPSADFGESEDNGRREAILRGYAGRRANDYK